MTADIIDMEAWGRKAPASPKSERSPTYWELVNRKPGPNVQVSSDHAEGDAAIKAAVQEILAAYPIDGADPDTQIMQASNRWHAVQHYWGHDAKDIDYSDAGADVMFEACVACEDIIAETPASTPAAMAIKVAMVRRGCDEGISTSDERALETLLADLERLGGAS